MKDPRPARDRDQRYDEGAIDMSKKFKAAGDTWRIRLGGPAVTEGHRNLLFVCESNGQRPYRVVEIPDDGSADEAQLERIGSNELEALFDRAASLGAPAS